MNKMREAADIVGEAKARPESRQERPVTVIDTEELAALRRELAAAKAALAFIGESDEIRNSGQTGQNA